LKNTVALYAGKDPNIYDDNIIKLFPKSNPYNILIESLNDLGFETHTLDIFKRKNIDPKYCIFLDIPKISVNKVIDRKKTISVVLLREADMVLKRNYEKKRHSEFTKILTWKNDLVDNKKYFYLPSAKVKLDKRLTVKRPFSRKLCCLINSNIKSNKNGELYSERRKVINWFEEFNLEAFDLYGYGWGKKNFFLFGRNFYFPRFMMQKKPSYRGSVVEKLQKLSEYKFTICFENTSVINSYLDEKIFDAFLANTIPIYWGCPNIKKLIPPNTFIDYREFKSIKNLYDHINNMSESEYMTYIDNINDFLESESIKKYTIENWLESILKVFKV
jgi:hypothetical protein